MLAWSDTVILMVEKAEQESWMILRRGEGAKGSQPIKRNNGFGMIETKGFAIQIIPRLLSFLLILSG
jgi:hypothetical protein